MDTNPQQRTLSPNLQQPQRNSSVYNSAVFHQEYKEIEMGLKQVKFQDQNLQHSIEIERQRLLKNLKFSNFNQSVDSKNHVRSVRTNNIIGRQSMMINKSRIIHSSSINKSQVYDQKLIQTIQELQKIVQMLRHNQRGYKIQIQSLMEQITYMKSIIEERQTLIARHTREVQVIRENSQCNQCARMRQQIHVLQENYRLQIQRISKTVSTNQTVILQRKVKQFQSLLIERDTIIKRLEHQLQAFSTKTNKESDKELRQKLISMEFEVTKLSQGLQRRDRQKIQYEQRIRQLSNKYDALIISTKNGQQDGKLIKQNSELKVQVQILQNQIERLKIQSKMSFEGGSQLKKAEMEKFQLQQMIIKLRGQIDILNKRMERMKSQAQETTRYWQNRQIQDKSRQKRIEELTITIRERDTQIFSLRQQLRKTKKQSMTVDGQTQDFNLRMRELLEQNRKMSMEIHNYRSSYQQIKARYEETQHIVQINQLKLQSFSQLELQIQQLKRENIELSQNKFPVFDLGNKKNIENELEQQNKRLKQQIRKLRNNTNNDDLMNKLVKSEQQVRILLDQIERLKQQSSVSLQNNHQIRQFQLRIFELESQINRLRIFQSKFLDYQQKIIHLQSRDNFQIVRLQNQIKILEAEIQRLNARTHDSGQNKIIDNSLKYEQQIHSLKIEINRLSIFQQQIITLQRQSKGEIIKLENQIKILEAEIQRLNARTHDSGQNKVIDYSSKYQQQIHSLKMEINRLSIFQNQIITLQRQSTSEIIKLENQTKNLEKEIQRLNLQLRDSQKIQIMQSYEHQISQMRVQIQRLTIVERNFFSLQQQLIHLQGQLRVYETEIERLRQQKKSGNQGGQSFQKYQRQIFQLKGRVQSLQTNEVRLLSIERQLSTQITQFKTIIASLQVQIQTLNMQLRQIRPNQSNGYERQILSLRLQIDRLVIIQRNFFEVQQKLRYLQSHPVKQIDQQTINRLKQAEQHITMLQMQIQRLRTFQARFAEIQKFEKLEQRFQIIEKIISEVLRVYKSSSFDYNLEHFINIPHYLSQLISIFISLHQKNFELNQLISSLEIQIFQLKRVNIVVQQSKYDGENLADDIEALENKILELKGSNQVYMRMNNALNSKLQSSQLQRQFIFNQFVMAKGELEKVQHENIIKHTISQHSENASIDIELLRSRIHQIESVTAISMDKMREYYQHIQNDVEFQLKDMRVTVDLLQSNNQQGVINGNTGKYRSIVTKLQMEVSQLQSSYKLFENTVSMNMRNTNDEIIKITDVMNERIKHVIEQSRIDQALYEQKNRLEGQLQQAQRYISGLENQKDQLSSKINQLRIQFELMKQESTRVQSSYNQAVGRSQKLQRERDELQITIRQIQDQKLQIERQLSTKINRDSISAQSEEQIKFLGNKLKDAQNQIYKLRTEKNEINQSNADISELTIRYEETVSEKNRIEQGLIDFQIKLKNLQDEKIRVQQNNKYLHHRCEELQGQLSLINQRIKKANKEEDQGELEHTKRELQQVIGKLVQAEEHIFKIQEEINFLVNQNNRLAEGCARLEQVEREYQKAIDQRVQIEQSLAQVEGNLKTISLQKTRIESQYSHIRNEYAVLQKTMSLKESDAGQVTLAINEVQSKLLLAQQIIRKNQQQKEELSRNIERLSIQNQRSAMLESNLFELKLENTRIIEQKSQKQQVLHQIETELNIIRNQKQELDNENHLLMSKYRELEIKASQLENVNQSQQALNQLQIVTNKLIEAEQYIFTIENQKNLLLADLEHLSQERSHNTEIERQIAQGNLEKQVLLNQNSHLQTNIHQLKSQISSLNIERQTLYNENIQLKNKQKQLRVKIDGYQLSRGGKQVQHWSQRQSIRSTVETYPPQFELAKKELSQVIQKLTQAQRYIFSMEEEKVVIVADIQKLITENGILLERVRLLQQNVEYLEYQKTQRTSKGQANYEAELNHLENLARELEKQKLILIGQNNQFKQQCQSLKARLDQALKDKYTEKLNQQILQQREALKNFQIKLSQSEEYIQTIQKIKDSLVKQNLSLNDQKEHLVESREQLSRKVEDLTAEVKQSHIEKISIQEKYEEIEKKTKLFEKAGEQVQSIVLSKNEQTLNLINQINQKTRILADQINEKQGLKYNLLQAEMHISQVQANLNNLNEDRVQLIGEINKLKEINQNLRISNEQFKQNNNNLSSKLEKLMMQGEDNQSIEELRILKSANTQLTEQNQKLRDVAEKLELVNRQIRANSAQLKKSSTNIESNHEEAIRNYQEQINICKEQIERQNHYIQTVENENRDMFESQQILRNQKQELESKLSKIQHPQVTALHINRQEMDRLSQANYLLQQQVLNMKKLNNSLTHFLGEFNGYLATLQRSQTIPQQVFDQYVFGDVPVIENLCQNILYKLRQLFSQDLDKEKRIKELQMRTKEADSIEKRYEQLLQQTIEQENTNKVYQTQINELQDQIRRNKYKLQDFTRQVSAKQGGDNEQYNRFLQQCVDEINRLENNSAVLAEQLNYISQNQRILQQSVYFSPERLAQLKELQEKLLKNEQEMRQDKEEDRKAINYIKDIIEAESPNIENKSKINEYLDQLQKNITQRINSDSSSLSSPKASQRVYSPNKIGHRRDVSGSAGLDYDRKEDLQREIKQLSEHLEIYHRQWQRRSELCLNMTIAAVDQTYKAFQAFQHLHTQYPEVGMQYADLGDRIVQVNKVLSEIENELKPNERLNSQIRVNPQYTHIRQEITVSPNFLQLTSYNIQRGQPTDQQFEYALKNLKLSIDQNIPERRNSEEGTQTDSDPKPLIDFLLRSNNLSSVDLVALKQKVASIRAREKSQNLSIMNENMRRIKGIVSQENSLSLNLRTIDSIINTMASNYSPTSLHKLFKHSSDKEVAMAMQEVVQAEFQQESHDYRIQNTGLIMNEIQQRKLKFYQIPTRISEDVHAAILKLISARNDQQFLDFIEELFETIFMIEQKFEAIIRKKDQQYREHTAKMNQIFNRSQSESSQEFDALLQDSADKRLSGQTGQRFSYGSGEVRRSEDMPRR